MVSVLHRQTDRFRFFNRDIFKGMLLKTGNMPFLFLLSVSICLLLLFPSFSFAVETGYVYDNGGRLIKVITGTGDIFTYSYDEVGNLISITSAVIEELPPLLSSMTPDVIFAGTTSYFVINGEHLQLIEGIYSDNPGVKINSFSLTDRTISVDITVSPAISLGQTNIIVKTPYGSAVMPATIAKLTFSPSLAVLNAGNSVSISGSIEPLLSRDLSLSLSNQNSDIISVPQTIRIPAGGSTIFTINALKEGAGVITAGNAGVAVYVSSPFQGDITALSKAVSIIRSVQGISLSAAISVKVGLTATGSSSSLPVSVELQNISNGTVMSVPVSVKISSQ